MSWVLLNFVRPSPSQKARTASGVYPRRRRPRIVGMRGSSQPLTLPDATSSWSLRLDVIVYDSCSRANSIWRGWGRPSMFSRNQSYSGRWFSNSRLHRECVIPSIASLWP